MFSLLLLGINSAADAPCSEFEINPSWFGIRDSPKLSVTSAPPPLQYVKLVLNLNGQNRKN